MQHTIRLIIILTLNITFPFINGNAIDSSNASLSEKEQILLEIADSYPLNIYETSLDSIISWSNIYLKDPSNIKYDTTYYKINTLLIKINTLLGNIPLAIKQSEDLLSDSKRNHTVLGQAYACKSLGELCYYIDDTHLSNSFNKEAIALFNKFDDLKGEKLQIYETILKNALKEKNISLYESTLSQFDSILDFTKLSDQISSSIFHCINYTENDQLKKAYPLLKEMKFQESQNELSPHFKRWRVYLNAFYYEKANNIPNAVSYYKQIFDNLKPNIPHIQYKDLMRRVGYLYLKIDKPYEAALCFKQSKEMSDELSTYGYLRQLNTLQKEYENGKKELEAKQEANQSLLLYTLILIASIVFFTFIAILIYLRIRRLRKSQKQLLISKQNAEDSIRAKSFFLSNMSHEIRTPLNAVVGFSSLLSDEEITPEERHQYNEMIFTNSQLLLKIINDVIDLSSLEYGKMNFSIHPCDIIPLCQNIVRSVSQIKHTEAVIKFQSTIDSLIIDTDPERLQQLLLNLIINSTKFTNKGSIILSVNQTKTNVIFKVTDTGCGIPLEKQSQIFDRFEKLNEFKQGSGLGLSICSLIISNLGGRIWIDPEYKEGACFVISHPLKQPVEA